MLLFRTTWSTWYCFHDSTRITKKAALRRSIGQRISTSGNSSVIRLQGISSDGTKVETKTKKMKKRNRRLRKESTYQRVSRKCPHAANKQDAFKLDTCVKTKSIGEESRKYKKHPSNNGTKVNSMNKFTWLELNYGLRIKILKQLKGMQSIHDLQ